MSKPIHVEASAVIDAPPEAVYAVIADYRVGHPAIVPKPPFSGITVEQGGYGAGTVIRFSTTMYGQTRHYHHTVSEPQPGRVLVEADAAEDVVTTFTVDPVNGGMQSRVTIGTDTKPSPGLQGWIERQLQPRIAQRLYQRELQQLGDYVKSK